MDRQALTADEEHVLVERKGAAARGNHGVVEKPCGSEDFPLTLTEEGFSVGGENFPNGPAVSSLDQRVEIVERDVKALSELLPDRRLPHRHESDEIEPHESSL